MNFRFPEVFGLLLLVALLCSFALPRAVSGRVENTFQFVFAPVTGPIQWLTAGNGETRRPDVPILSASGDEVVRLRQEKVALTNYIEILRGQLETLAHREAEASRIGEELKGHVTTVKVIGVDAAGRDVLRLAGTSAGTIEKDQPVVVSGGLVGRILEVGLGNQSSARLITDRGFKLLGRFGRYVPVGDGTVQLAMLPIDPTLIEGAGNGTMRIDSLTTAIVESAGLQEHDLVVLSDADSTLWPIEVHGYRIGRVLKVGKKLDMPGVAEVIVTPEIDLLKLKDVWVVTRDQTRKP